MSGDRFPVGVGIILFAISSRSAPIQLVHGGSSPELTSHLHLVPSLRMREAIPPLPHAPSWRGAS